MTDKLPQTNFERLQNRLKKDSLAAKLVAAYMGAAPAGQQAALKKVISDRLNELRQGHAGTTDQKI